MGKHRIKLKRAYEDPAPGDGTRLLVDRMWPRGRSKEALHLDGWIRDVAPSAQLRTWFSHDPAKWDTFKRRYFRELDHEPEAIARLREAFTTKTVTLVYGAKDTEHNNAVALKEYLEQRAGW